MTMSAVLRSVSFINLADTPAEMSVDSFVRMPARVMPADMQAILGLSGQRFGRWTALYVHDKKQRGDLMWVCRCDCGTVRPVLAPSLRSGRSTSCGCAHREKLS